MSSKSVNEHILELQKELERLKSATTHIEMARDNSNNIIKALSDVQENYIKISNHVGDIFTQQAQEITSTGKEQAKILQANSNTLINELRTQTQALIEKSSQEINAAKSLLEQLGTSNIAEIHQTAQQHIDKSVDEIKKVKESIENLGSTNLQETRSLIQKLIDESVAQISVAQKAVEKIGDTNLKETQKLMQQHSDIITKGQKFLDSMNSFNLLEWLQNTDKELIQLQNLISNEAQVQKKNLNKTISNINEQTGSVQTLLQTSIAADIAELDKKTGKIDKSLSNLENKVGKASNSSGVSSGIYSELDKIVSQLNTTQSDLGQINNDVNQVSNSITGIQDDISKMKSSIEEKVEEKTNNLKYINYVLIAITSLIFIILFFNVVKGGA